MNRKRTLAGLVLALLIVSIVPVAATAQAPRAPVDPTLSCLEANGQAGYWSCSRSSRPRRGPPPADQGGKGPIVYERLVETATRTQPLVRPTWTSWRRYKSFWIRNMFQVEVTSMAQVNALAAGRTWRDRVPLPNYLER